MFLFPNLLIAAFITVAIPKTSTIKTIINLVISVEYNVGNLNAKPIQKNATIKGHFTIPLGYCP